MSLMTCPDCREQVSDQVTACPNCGYPLTRCSACGQRLDPSVRICPACGAVQPDQSTLPIKPTLPGTLPSNLHDGEIPAEVHYAGFWRRCVASFLDNVITTVLGTVGGVVSGVVATLGGADIDAVQTVATVTGVTIQWLYHAVMVSSPRQATWGKQALGIYVTTVHGERLTFGRAAARHFAKLLSVFTLLIGFLIMPFTARKQALHDLIAGTIVLRR